MPDVQHFSDSEESFHSFDDNEPLPPRSTQPPAQNHNRRTSHESTLSDDKPRNVVERFPPEEEAILLAESNSLKGSANQLFGKGSFENAIQTYDKALASCPNYLDFEIAVLKSNIAACNIKMEEWKAAIESATKGIDCLERLEPLPHPKPKTKPTKDGSDGVIAESESKEREDNIIEEVDDDLATRIENLQKSGHTLDEVRKLQVKLLMRRAKARGEDGSWAALQGADEDYKTLLLPTMLPTLSPTDRRSLLEAARKLTPRLNEAKDKEVAEMMSKLKGLGNTLLKPFGLSTNNFNFVQDQKTGGYSMNFSQEPPGK